MLRAGQLNKRITIQANAKTRDDDGEWVDGWSDVGKAWADVYAKSGQERALGNANQGFASFTVKMRPFSGLTVAHRIKWGSRYLGITFIDDSTPGELRIDASELTGRETP